MRAGQLKREEEFCVLPGRAAAARGFFTKSALRKLGVRTESSTRRPASCTPPCIPPTRAKPRAGSGCSLVCYRPLGAAPAGSLFQALL